MSVSNVNGIGRVVLPATANRNPGTPEPAPAPASVREPSAAPDGNSLVQIDDATNQPIPPRYPWLSRLARELEPVSKQPSPYGTIELLGEKLDKQA